MEMNAVILVERFDNGITLQWADGVHDSTRSVALEGNEPESIGKEIWSDILEVLTTEPTQKVQVTLNYKAI